MRFWGLAGGWAGLLCRLMGSWVRALAGGGLGWTGLWVRGFVGRSRVRVGELRLFASSRRVWKVGHAINHIYYGEILGASRSIRTIDSYILRSDFREKCRKTMYFYQVFKVFGGKSDRFATAKGRRGYAKRSERSSLVRGRSFVNFLQVHEGSGRWVTQ